MNYVGIDLHKNSIVTCVMNQDRKVTHRRTFACGDTRAIRDFFASLGPFQALVEATAATGGDGGDAPRRHELRPAEGGRAAGDVAARDAVARVRWRRLA